jgi:hypothetical protein
VIKIPLLCLAIFIKTHLHLSTIFYNKPKQSGVERERAKAVSDCRLLSFAGAIARKCRKAIGKGKKTPSLKQKNGGNISHFEYKLFYLDLITF